MAKTTVPDGETVELTGISESGSTMLLRVETNPVRVGVNRESIDSGSYLTPGMVVRLKIPSGETVVGRGQGGPAEVRIDPIDPNRSFDNFSFDVLPRTSTSITGSVTVDQIASTIELDDGTGNVVSNTNPLPINVVGSNVASYMVENSAGTVIDPATEATLAAVEAAVGSTQTRVEPSYSGYTTEIVSVSGTGFTSQPVPTGETVVYKAARANDGDIQLGDFKLAPGESVSLQVANVNDVTFSGGFGTDQLMAIVEVA